MIKVNRGTVTHGKHLCLTCANSMRNQNDRGNENVFCNMFSCRIASKIVECNQYRDKNQPDIWELRQIAWVITGDTKIKPGFVRYRDMPDDEQSKIDRDLRYRDKG